jgi:hypothetical protein
MKICICYEKLLMIECGVGVSNIPCPPPELPPFYSYLHDVSFFASKSISSRSTQIRALTFDLGSPLLLLAKFFYFYSLAATPKFESPNSF